MPKSRGGRGRGKKRPEMTNAPIIVPTSYSHLLHMPEPKGGLTVTFSKEEQLREVETTVQHLEQLLLGKNRLFNHWIMQEMAPHSLGRTTLLHKSVLPNTMIFSLISF